MMGKTHFTIGLATSLAIMQPESFNECAVALIAGAFGGVTPDNDLLDQTHSLSAQLYAMVTTFIVLLADFFFKWGICEHIMANQTRAMIGLIGFLVFWIIGCYTDHRTFTHSLTAMFIYSLFFGFIYEPFTLCFMAAYLSHLLLDMLNKKKVPIFYPLDFGIALKLCYANGKFDVALMYIGGIVSAVLLIMGFASGITA